MIPWLATVRVGGSRRAVRLWLPLFPLWPLMPLLVVAALVLSRLYGVDPAGSLRAAWQLMSGLRGTYVDIDSPDFALRVRLL